MSGQGNDTTTGGGGKDTLAGASFALTVPGPGTPAMPTFADLSRIGAVDSVDEPLLNSDPNNTASTTFATTKDAGGNAAAYPFSAGGLTYTIDTLQMVGPHAYLRVGKPGGYEYWLPTNPDTIVAPAPNASQAGSKPLGGNGIVIYSQEQISNFAPAITNTAKSINTSVDQTTTWTTGSQSATYYDTSYHSIGILTGQVKNSIGMLTNQTYQVADVLTTTVGNTVSTFVGNAANVWLGADASTGAGSLLWSNFGVTENIFGGSIINVTNTSVEVQGYGEAKISDLDVLAPAQISLAVSGVASVAATSATLASLANKMALVSTALAGVVTATLAATPGIMADTSSDLGLPLETIRVEMDILTGLSAALQIAAVVAGKLISNLKKTAAETTAGSITIQNGSIVLSAGGTTVTINGAGFRVDAGDPAKLTTAIAAMTLAGVQQPLWDQTAGLVMSQAATPATANMIAALIAAPMYAPPPVVPAVPIIKLNSLTSIQASAAQIQFSTPV